VSQVESSSDTAWSPVIEERIDVVHEVSAKSLHRVLDLGEPAPREGDSLPPLWHWLAFLPDAAERFLGDDGHPRSGVFMPPTTLPRRMFASASIDFIAPVHIGQTLLRRSEVTDVADKKGRTGPLTFVEVTHEVLADGDTAIREVQQLVYRDHEQSHPGPARDAVATVDSSDVGETWEWQRELLPDSRMLFRFSALTYNTHRIHYDREYASGVEGYPGLVVHGPLQAVALAQLCRDVLKDRTIAAFRFRAVRPAFDGAPIQLRGRVSGENTVELAAFDDAGRRTVSASVTLHSTKV
jgi:3-methylfumaryl-CoA hydratase